MFPVKRSLFTKILISLLIATIIPFIASNYISYQITGKAINKQLVELNQNSMAITMSGLHTYFHELSLLGLSYYGNPNLDRILSSKETQTPAETVYITQQFERIYGSHSEIGSVSYKSALTNKQFNIRNDYSSRVNIPDFVNRELSTQRDELSSEFIVTYNHNEPKLRVNRYFMDISTREVIGLTTFNVDNSEIKKTVGALSTSQDGSIYLFIQDDLQLLYSSLPSNEKKKMDWVNSLYEETTGKEGVIKGAIYDQDGTYIYYRDVSYNLPVTLAKFIPQSVVNKAQTTVLGQSLIVQVGAIILVGIIAAIISYYILRRVKRILKQIKNIQMGNFNIKVRPQSNSPDELNILEERFQEMTIELDELWNKQYRHQLELSHARLKMLQAQINPHFFYNTLQSIGTLAIKNNSREISDRIAEFAAIFRYNMDIDTEVVSLQEELDHVSHYTSLQMGRYKNKLTYAVQYPEEAYSLKVPKMVLQPLVENSIVHGLEKGTGKVEIRVDIEVVNNYIYLSVNDNGKGFTPEEIQKIHLSYVDQNMFDDEKAGIGLTNVLKRLLLFYGETFEWQIISEPYVQTTISLKLPNTTNTSR
ncbi:sensor histidine kinase [Paenibacillus endoradicis]|uniref:sensor histidine kinase n=1 Tax=Paenibacillus endoradicis TaxID=2972487 RepID=UPI0021598D6B|nr:histidine kinase [Paenibacillus endoradicis]MCR8657081.1 histidine kinase [Paenibacillus endoradicis]